MYSDSLIVAAFLFTCGLNVIQVEQLNKDYAEKRISKTDLIQRKLEATDKYLG